MTTTTTVLSSTWSLSAYFPAFNSPEYAEFKRDYKTRLEGARTFTASLGGRGGTEQGNTTNVAAKWADGFIRWEDLSARSAHLSSYIGCLGAADTASEALQTEEAALAVHDAELAKVKTQLLLALRECDEATFEQILKSPALQNAAHTVRRFRDEARFQMPVEQEALASDLGVDGFKAWGRLYDTVSGKMSFEMTFPDGRVQTVPMAQRNGLTSDADRAIRRAAFVEGNKIWAAAGDTCASALNALAGTRHTLYARRGRTDFLAAPLHDAAASRTTLEAMFTAISANYALPRKLLALGARLQKTPALAWYDLNAPRPLNQPATTFTWQQGVDACQAAFDSAYPKLGNYFREIVNKRWIESEKRANKKAGAFQTSSPLIKEERIFMTFAGKVNDVVTLAHEAGHAWHTHLLGDLRPCCREYPMTLAETASTFAEKILVHGLLSDPALTPERRAFLLDMETNHMPAYLLNIPVRFLFESRFYEERRSGVVSATRLCELMVAAQREVYGDVLEEGAEDPWFWASKLHFFITDVSFYNFPYTFGFLLSEALFAEFQAEGPSFLPKYEAFLKESGRATCEEAVRATLGWEIDRPEFWSKAIAACEAPIRQFAETVEPNAFK